MRLASPERATRPRHAGRISSEQEHQPGQSRRHPLPCHGGEPPRHASTTHTRTAARTCGARSYSYVRHKRQAERQRAEEHRSIALRMAGSKHRGRGTAGAGAGRRGGSGVHVTGGRGTYRGQGQRDSGSEAEARGGRPEARAVLHGRRCQARRKRRDQHGSVLRARDRDKRSAPPSKHLRRKEGECCIELRGKKRGGLITTIVTPA